MQKINNIIISIVFAIILVGIGILVYGHFLEEKEKDINQKVTDNVKKTKKYIENNFEGNFPLPSGDLVLLNNKKQQIHLENKNKDLKQIKNLYVIQGTTCGLDIDDKKFQKNNFDPRFSTGENKKCFAYSVTKNQKKFQIGYIKKKGFKYISYITGSHENNIIKDYKSNYIVKNGTTKTLPYMPKSNNKIKLVLKKGKGDIKIKEDGLEVNTNNSKIKDGIYIPKDKNANKIKINITGEEFTYKLIYPNGNVQLLSPNKNNKAKLVIKDFEYNGKSSSLNIASSLGKVAYSLTRLGSNSEYNISDNQGGSLVIRGTEFVTENDKKLTTTYLSEGNIYYKTKNDKFSLKNKNNTIGFGTGQELINIFDFPKRLSNLYGYNIVVDILLNKSKKLSIKPLKKNLNKTKQLKENNIRFKTGYKINVGDKEYERYMLSGYFNQDYAVELVKNRNNINNILSNICSKNGKEKIPSINKGHNFLNIENISSEGIKFKLKQNLKDKIDKNQKLPFENFTPNNSYITYFDKKSGKIKYENISSFDNKKGQRGLSIICE